MSLNNTIACPLDCFDTCEAVLNKDNIIKGNKEHFTTNGKLCVNFANLLKENYLDTAFINKEKTSLDNALEIFSNKLKTLDSSKTLYYKGSGNLGVFQSAPKVFFSNYGSVFTQGSLCEGAGDEGIALGRSKTINPPIEKLINSDIIIVWGRNFSISSPHMYNLVKDKTFITIDPINTPIAKKSALHLQINPKTDHELALFFSKYIDENNLEDKEFIKNNSTGVEEFLKLANSKSKEEYLKSINISNEQVEKFFDLIKNKNVSIVLGIGVQKYYEGVNITRTIDSFAAYLGLHNKKSAGLWYLGDSVYAYEKKFPSSAKKKIDIPEVDFSQFDLVFIQGANPVVSSPNTKRVIEGLKNTFVVFFGTTFNETCEYADIIIPSSNFKAKKDVRLSYGHNYKAVSYAIEEKQNNSISEYDFTKYMNKKFGFDNLIDEDEAFQYYANKEYEDHSFIENFKFIEKLEVKNLYEEKKEDEYYLVFLKRKNNLNSQFKSDDFLYINPDSKIPENTKVLAKTKYGKASFVVKHDENIKENCVALYAGNKNANYLTNHESDEFASSAIYQEALVKLELS